MNPVRTHKDAEEIGEYAMWGEARIIVKPWGQEEYLINAYK